MGLANVGKSTFFQAITKSELGNPANYPFATIKPQEARVVVSSDELDHLARLYGSQNKVPAVFKIFDIAGLVRGASSGQGLGNQFLSDIRAVDGIYQVVRGFRDDEITHIEGNVDPVRDLSVVLDELLLKDMEFVESAIDKTTRAIKSNKLLAPELECLEKCLDWLMEGRRIEDASWDDSEIDIINKHNLLTAKPCVYLLNVNGGEESLYRETVMEWIETHSPRSKLISFSAADAQNLAEIVSAMRRSLHLVSFYTCGEKEARQWTVRENSSAPEAAGVIHTDLQRTFINANVVKYADLASANPPLDEKWLKGKGKITRVGKSYIVGDGDVLMVKAAAGKARS